MDVEVTTNSDSFVDINDIAFIDQDTTTSHADSQDSCQYCGVNAVDCIVRCVACNKWFCNAKSNSGSSHIVTHLTLSHHNTVALHADTHLGDTTLECYLCNKTNVFNLGYISAKADQVVVILCRLPCSQIRDLSWDSASWKPLIDNREFLPWVAAVPGDDDLLSAAPVSHADILRLESNWRLNRETDKSALVPPAEILPVLMRYTDGYQYQKCYAPLVQLEADYDKELKESQALEHIQVTWETGDNNNYLASFALSTFDSGILRFGVGDEIILRYNQLNKPKWESHGYIIRLPTASQEFFTVELLLHNVPPVEEHRGFTAEFVWKGTSFERMQLALVTFATKEKCISSFLYHKILGHEVNTIEFDITVPKKLSVPGLAPLNDSQMNAVSAVLLRPFSLIQGPPGTGKTVTSASIVYHLTNLNKGHKILVCAPSNVAVDHLAAQLDRIGLNVVRLVARLREDIDGDIDHLSLHRKLGTKKGPLQDLMELKALNGRLDGNKLRKYQRLLRDEEALVLDKCDVICCTCVGAGDRRLQKYKFRTVLIDECTQATEPESLIPLVKGCRQVILVGDHQQLGPVIVHKQAGECGLRQSLFQRLIGLGHVPIRLEVQYRMNPHLSEFPSNMFYEGSLQDGVTVEERLIENSTFPWPIATIPMFFWGNYGKEEISGSGSSFLNRVEVMNVEKIITRLFKDGINPSQIGIITPYEGQRAFMTQYLSLNYTLLDRKADYLQVEVSSVDAFQGREKDFIILSCVRANEQQNIGFLRDPRRLNVALTRAKYGLIILGNIKSLSKNPLWNHLLLHFREHGCMVDGTLENLRLSTIPLSTSTRIMASGAGAVRGVLLTRASEYSAAASVDSVNTDQWPQLNRPITSNFYAKLNELDMEYARNTPRVNEDDIKSITSSFIDGFNLN